MVAPPERLLQRLEWQVVRRLDGRLQGSYRTHFRGSGLDFAELRGYVPEDDVRHIDWNVTARLGEPFVRRYTEDRDLTAWLVLDRSASMRFGRPGQGKDDVLVTLALSLARLLTRTGNRVGAVLYDNDAHRVIPPRSGRRHLLRLGHELTVADQAPTDPAPTDQAPTDRTTTDLAGMIQLAGSLARRRGLIFLISDFLGDLDWERPLGQLAQRHDVVVLRIVDPGELVVADLGVVLVEDAETGEQLLVDTSDPFFRARHLAAIEAREAALDTTLRSAGVRGHRISTASDLTTTLLDLVQWSERRHR